MSKSNFPLIQNKSRGIFGVGINDADYVTQPTVNGKHLRCPYYVVWNSMLKRCYSLKYKDVMPTYEHCTVFQPWLRFSEFRRWMVSQDWEGNQLDKDIIKPRNKHYCPEFCTFVPQSINSLITDRKEHNGPLPPGVTFVKRTGRYMPQLSINGKRDYLGYFDTPEEASRVYREAKSKHVREVALQQSDPRVREGLLRHADLIRCASCERGL